MDMIALNGKVNEAKPRGGGARKAPAQCREQTFAAHRREAGRASQRHVNRMPAGMTRPPAVGYPGARVFGLATGSRTTAAPAAEMERALRIAPHLDWADIIESKAPCQGPLGMVASRLSG